MIPTLVSLFALKVSPQTGAPLPPAVIPLDKIRKAVLDARHNPGTEAPAWRQSQSSWNTAWGQDAFGIGELNIDTFRYRFRVPPDANKGSLGGKPTFLVEAYENGFPTCGMRQDGSWETFCRPLGFRYGSEGIPTNASVQIFQKGSWTRLRLSKRDWLVLSHVLSANEYTTGIPPIPDRSRFDSPWVKITAKGYGDYWIARNLECVGPFGTSCRLISEIEPTLRDLIGEPKEDQPHSKP